MTTVSEVMKSPVVTATPNDKLADLLSLVLRRHVRHFPVVEDGRLVGIVTDRDLRLAATHPAISWICWRRWTGARRRRS